MFSSGTTGKPKGIVHGAGGTLLEHKKELVLHADVRPGDRVFYQTSTSWMMWNWLASALACDATVLMYDGDSMAHDGMILWQMARDERVTHFGTSAAYIGEIEKRGIHPTRDFSLDDLRAIFSTGSTLFPSSFDYVREKIKPLWLQSISGGTDILGCFGLGCPLKPVIRGEVQCKSLGYDVRVLDASGRRVIGEQGELVCASPAPSMPVHFLDDPDGEAYRQAYFSDFPGVWRHGDFVEETPEGGLIFGGRSDATLKPGGVRVATADIYAALQRIPEIAGALAVGYTPAHAAAEKIVLFVVLKGETVLTADVENTIRSELKRSNAFYVPALVLQAPELPRTTNNKLAELSVKKILKGEEPGNASALANPDSLKYFTSKAVHSVKAALG
jgi:acetoacetyl-CoA synthetase